MKIEVLFVAASIDAETYEAEYLAWVFGEGLLVVFAGETEGETSKVATYPENRVVRVQVVEAA